jgi:hypothetical protein
MRLALAALCLAGCSFQPGQISSGDAAIDGRPIDARLDGPPSDAAPDAMLDAAMATTSNFGAAQDTTLWESDKNTNFGADNASLVDGGADPDAVILMRFNLSSIPATATVTAAELHVWTTQEDGDGATLYPVLQFWAEGDATWMDRVGSTNWTSDGAAPPSRGTTPIGTVAGTAAATEYTSAITLATVQAWVTTSATNFGLAFVTTSTDGTGYVTKESAMTARRPYLRVTYSP